MDLLGFVEVLRKKVLEKILSVCLRRQKTKTIWDFVKKSTSLHSFVALKKANNNNRER